MAKKVYLKGEEFVFTKVKGSSETDYREGDVNINPTNIGLGSVNNTSDKDKPVSTAQQKAIDVAYANSNKYTDQKIANLINGAPETMDTLKEVSDAISASKSTEEALNKAIGTKANQTELDTHTGNDTIHITASERAKWNKNGGVTGIRGSAESDYKTGQVTISKENIGLGNVDNTADSNKSVKYATSAGSASTSDKVSNKLTIASPINSYNDLYFRDEIVTEAIQYDGSSAMTVNLMNVRSDSYQNTVKFTSNDSTIGDSTAPSLLKSGETHASIFSKVSTIFKNVRWLLSKMGTTDISSLGDGTVTGALSTLNSNMDASLETDHHTYTNIKGTDRAGLKAGNYVAQMQQNGQFTKWLYSNGVWNSVGEYLTTQHNVAKVACTNWGTELNISGLKSSSLFLVTGSDLYCIWLASTADVHIHNISTNEKISTATGTATLGKFTVTRTGSGNCKITASTNQTMLVFYY